MKELSNINGLKAILALIIVFHHLTHYQIIGAAAVSVFLTISGILIGMKYNNDGGYSLKNVTRSIGKLYAPYLIALTFFVLLYIFIKHKPIEQIVSATIAHVLLIQSWDPFHSIILLNSPTWYISSYLGILLIFLLYRWTFVRNKYIHWFLWIFLLCLSGTIGLSLEDKVWWFYFTPYMRFFEFIIAYHIGNYIKIKQVKCMLSYYRFFSLFAVLVVLYCVTVFLSQKGVLMTICQDLSFLCLRPFCSLF